MIVGSDDNLLVEFKRCAESGLEWNGDLTKLALFRVWMSSFKSLIDFESEEIERPTGDNSGGEDDDEDVKVTASNRTSKIIDETVAFRSEKENTISYPDYTSFEDQVIDGTLVQTIDFVEADDEDFANMEIGAMATVVADGNEFVENDATVDEFLENNLVLTTIGDIDAGAFANVENNSPFPSNHALALQPSTSKAVFEILNEIRPVVMPEVKRKPVKKPSVISSSSNIKKKTEVLMDKQQKQIDKENRKAARELQLAAKKQKLIVKRRKSDSFVLSETPSSECHSTPEKPRQKKKKLCRHKIFSPSTSSSAPATPIASSSPFEMRHIFKKSKAKRPVFPSGSDSE